MEAAAAAAQGTRASMVIVAEVAAPGLSNQGTRSLKVGCGCLRWGREVAAWLTMDSRVPVPVARGSLSHVYLLEKVVADDGCWGWGLSDTRGWPSPCIASCPFSHVNSATS